MKLNTKHSFSTLILATLCALPLASSAQDDRASSAVKQQASSGSAPSNPDGNRAPQPTTQPSDMPADTSQNTAIAQKYLELWNLADSNDASLNSAMSPLFNQSFKLESDTLRLLAGEQLGTEAEVPAGAAPADNPGVAAPVPPATGDAAVLMKAMQQLRKAVPDLKVTLDDVFAHENVVVAKWTATGTFKEPLLGAEPTNRMHKVSGVDIHKFLDGRIVSIYSLADTARLNRDLRNAPDQPAHVDSSANSPAAPATPATDPGTSTAPTAPVTP